MSAPTAQSGSAFNFRPGEKLPAFLSFLLYFCVLGGYFAVRPVRETIGTVLGDERVRDLFVHTWIWSLAIVPIYGFLCSRLSRSAFLTGIYSFVILALAGCGVIFLVQGEDVISAGEFFFVLISVLNLFIVSLMWSFLLELYTAEQTKRLFGFIAAGGTTGALAGPYLTSHLVGVIGNGGILLFGAGLFVLALVCQRILLAIWSKAAWRDEAGGGDAGRKPIGGNPFAGVTLVFKSPYLLGIALFVIFISTVNTLLYFEQLNIVRDNFSDTAERTVFFARIDTTVQSLTVLLQLFLTGRLAQRWGIGILLTAVPILMVIGMSTLALAHTLPVFVGVIILRRVGEYAFIRPGREMLYSQVPTEAKYKAKNFIDVPVYRGGDALVSQLTGGVSGSLAAALGAGVAVLWVGLGAWLGISAKRREAEHQAGSKG